MSYVTPARLGQFKELQDDYNETIYLKKVDIGDYFATKRVDFANSDWVKDGELYKLSTGKAYVTEVYGLDADGTYHNTATSIYKSTTCTLVSTTAFTGFYTYMDTVTVLTEKDGDGDEIADKYATNSYLASNFYNKSTIDGLCIGLTDSEIDAALVTE